jgi:hypothetical protein
VGIAALLSAGWWFDLGNGPDLFRSYGFPALIVALCGAVFGIWRKLEGRPKATVFLIPDDLRAFGRNHASRMAT